MKTLAQKIIARAAGVPDVAPGEIVTCKVDLAMSHDSSGPRRIAPMLESLGARVWDPDKYVIVTDHYVPALDPESRQILQFTRDWVSQNGIRKFHDEQGICHVVLPEQGYVRPGMLIVGGDSHSTTGGAFGSYMFGIGATEMLGVLVTGEIWLKMPHTIAIEWKNAFADGVVAKDIMLYLCGQLGMDGGQYQAVEFGGSAITALNMQERMTLANMTAELGGQAGLIAPDETTIAYLLSAGVSTEDLGDLSQWKTDEGAPVLARHVYDGTALAPQVAAPHSPANAADVGSYKGQEIDTAYIGACTGAKLEDLRMAARVLKGRRVASGKRLLVAPASLRDQQAAKAEGTLDILTEAGGELLPIGCGACAGYGQWRFAENERVLSSSARNFKGRMGALSSQVWLASPYTVAASIVTGQITDPRILLGESA
ncbi:MAG: 3-isopropylmalate dehydratase large subunit [Herminiimonas sp.]|nr:3-isopropylmalate dehydratase large subunit [Herminiimonas sp.]